MAQGRHPWPGLVPFREADLALNADDPWPGLRPFREADHMFFHGRDSETGELYRSVRSTSVTVLFGKSGIGKTSLLEAGLFPMLRANHYLPIYLRIDYSDAPDAQIEAPFAHNLTTHAIYGPTPDSEKPLSTFLSRSEFHDSQKQRVTPVLIFDQFEELFSFARVKQSTRPELFEELAALTAKQPVQTADRLYLFVSHVAEDHVAAMEIVTQLERRGIPCWIAPRNVRAGYPFDDEIVDAIEASRAMLLIFSDRCNDSAYIRREVTVAAECEKLIIPFRIENAEPRRGLRIRLTDLHWMDGFVARERAIDTLIEQLGVTGPEVRGDACIDGQTNYRLIFSIREEWLPELLEQLPPSILLNRFRLRPLRKEQARESIVRAGSSLVDAHIAEQIVDFLTVGYVASDEYAAEVEPALLSIVCRGLNHKRRAMAQRHISLDHLGGIVEDFYKQALEGLDPRVKSFIETQLVTADGRAGGRAVVDAVTVPGVSREAIEKLVARRVLRFETQFGALWVGPAHDRIAQVIHQHRDAASSSRWWHRS